MKAEKILDKLLSLPADAQKEAADFIAFLQTRYPSVKGNDKKKKRPLRDEPFFGMWKDREDMKDSVAWVRKIREEQWNRHK